MWLTASPCVQQVWFPLPLPLPAGLNSMRMSITPIQRSLCCFCSASTTPPPVQKKRNRYRKLYPGETIGITEEMRFVAMRLRNSSNSTNPQSPQHHGADSNTWQPSIEGFLSYLVDSNLVFYTLERIIDESDDVSYAYFRNTGLERSEGLSKDLEGFKEQGLVIPNPSSPGLAYAEYLEELGQRSASLFLSHFYNIHFSHIAGGQVIAKQVSKNLLEGKELEFYRWEGDVQELLKGVREKLNMLAEHWSRDEKNRCLKETTKSFRFMGQIVRLIIL